MVIFKRLAAYRGGRKSSFPHSMMADAKKYTCVPTDQIPTTLLVRTKGVADHVNAHREHPQYLKGTLTAASSAVRVCSGFRGADTLVKAKLMVGKIS